MGLSVPIVDVFIIIGRLITCIFLLQQNIHFQLLNYKGNLVEKGISQCGK